MKRIIVKSHLREGKIVRQHNRLIKRVYMGKHKKKKAYKKLRSWTPEEMDELSEVYGDDFHPDAGEWKY